MKNVKKMKKTKNKIEVSKNILAKAHQYLRKIESNNIIEIADNEKVAIIIPPRDVVEVEEALKKLKRIRCGDFSGGFTSNLNEESKKYLETMGDILTEIIISLDSVLEDRTQAIIGESPSIEMIISQYL